MKIKLIMAAGLVFVGLNANADLKSNITENIMDTLNDEGYFDNLTESEFIYTEERVKDVIDAEFAKFNYDDIRLGENNVQAAFLGDLWNKVKEAASTVVEKVKSVGESIIEKAKPLVEKFGPTLIAAAKDLAPAVATLVGPQITKFAADHGLPEAMVKGALAQVAGNMTPEEAKAKFSATVPALLDKLGKEAGTTGN